MKNNQHESRYVKLYGVASMFVFLSYAFWFNQVFKYIFGISAVALFLITLFFDIRRRKSSTSP